MSTPTTTPYPLSPTGTLSRPGVRMRTVVTGLVALAISTATLLNQLTEIDIPAQAVTLTILIGAGVLLLGSGVLAAVREQRQQHEQADPYGARYVPAGSPTTPAPAPAPEPSRQAGTATDRPGEHPFSS